MDRKTCPRCGQTLALASFGANRSSHDGLQTYCRGCISAYFREYNKARRDRLRVYNETHRARHREAESARVASWTRSNPEKAKDKGHRRRARKMDTGAYLVSGKDLARLTTQGCQHAHYGTCHGPMHVDHIVPLARGGRHSIGNLQALCQRHNTSKGDKLEIEVQVRQKARATRETTCAHSLGTSTRTAA